MMQSASARPRLPGLRRGAAASVVVLLLWAPGLAGAFSADADAAGSHAVAPPHRSSPLVAILRDHVVQTRPNDQAPRVGSIAALRPLTGVRTVLPVLSRAIGRHGKAWLHVRLPGRPNSHAGWIAARQTRRGRTAWSLSLDLSARLLTVRRFGHVTRHFRVVVGAPLTPTPRGRFFVEEALAMPGQVGGPYALATSARSDVLQEFEGGPGQIALHGRDDLGGVLGTAASHGCIRLDTPAITWLAQRVGGGVRLAVVQ